METILFKDKTYYLNGARIYDEYFLEIPRYEAEEILRYYYTQIDYRSLDEEDILHLIIEVKDAELFNYCLTITLFALTKYYSFQFKKTVLPIITSCYRLSGSPQKAIDYWLENIDYYRDCVSAPVLTSIAAAYCDIGDYANAKKYANAAYAFQGGKPEYENELTLVYRRIQKESKL